MSQSPNLRSIPGGRGNPRTLSSEATGAIETALIAGMLFEPSQVAVARSSVEPHEFLSPRLARIAATLFSMHEQEQPIEWRLVWAAQIFPQTLDCAWPLIKA